MTFIEENDNNFSLNCGNATCGDIHECESCSYREAKSIQAEEQAEQAADKAFWADQQAEIEEINQRQQQIIAVLPGLKRRITGGDNRGCRYLDAADERRFKFLGMHINWNALALHNNPEPAVLALTSIVELGRAAAATDSDTATMMHRYNNLIEKHGDTLAAPEYSGVFPAEQMDQFMGVLKGLILARITCTPEQLRGIREFTDPHTADFIMPSRAAELKLAENIGGAIRLPLEVTIHPRETPSAFTARAEIKIAGDYFAEVSW